MDVEFLGPDGGAAAADDEELDTRRPPNRRRLVVLASVAAVALAVAGVLIAQHGGGGTPAAGAPTIAVVLTPAPVGPPDMPVLDGAPAVVVDGTIVTIAGDSLVWKLGFGGGATASTRLPDPSEQYTLVADPAHHLVWLVLIGSSPFEATKYASRGPQAPFSFGADGAAEGAAVLDGRVYVDTDAGVVRLSMERGGLMDRTNIRGGYGIAADPSRHRLLLIDDDGAPRVRAQRPGQPTPERTAPLPFAKGSLAVVGGHIWAGGYGETGAVLVQLDPRTLRPVRHSPVAPALGPGANIVASGTHAFLVRSGAGGDGLWCVDARNGALLHYWTHIVGSVVFGPSGVVSIASASGASELTSGRCTA